MQLHPYLLHKRHDISWQHFCNVLVTDTHLLAISPSANKYTATLVNFHHTTKKKSKTVLKCFHQQFQPIQKLHAYFLQGYVDYVTVLGMNICILGGGDVCQLDKKEFAVLNEFV